MLPLRVKYLVRKIIALTFTSLRDNTEIGLFGYAFAVNELYSHRYGKLGSYVDSCTCSFTTNNWWQRLFSPTLTLMLVGYDDHDLGRLEGPTKVTKVDEKPRRRRQPHPKLAP